MKLLIRLAINAAALWAAASIVDGIDLDTEFWTLVLIAAVFGIVNAFIKPVVMLFSIPALILTLGLFTVVINAAMLGITAALTDGLDIDGFGSALLGALIVSFVSWLLSMFFTDDNELKSKR